MEIFDIERLECFAEGFMLKNIVNFAIAIDQPNLQRNIIFCVLFNGWIRTSLLEKSHLEVQVFIQLKLIKLTPSFMWSLLCPGVGLKPEDISCSAVSLIVGCNHF